MRATGRVGRSRYGSFFLRRVMVVADDAGDLPSAIFVLPEVNETGLAHAFRVFVPRMVEAVDAHFDSAISLHVVNLQRSGNEFPSHFVANVFLYAVSERRSAKSDTALIVIELDVVGEEKKKTFRGRSDCRSQRERHRARQWLCLVRPEI